MSKLEEGKFKIDDPAVQKIVDDINREEEELEKNPPAPEGEPKTPEAPESKKEPETEGEPSTPPAKDRPVETMSLPKWKVFETEKKLEKLSAELDLSKKEREELQKQLENAQKNPPKAVDDELREYAESIGADPQVIQGLVGILSKRFAPPEDYQKIIAAQKEREEGERLKQEAFAEFDTDFAALSEKHPEAANLKDKLKELAFSDAYHTYSLAHIFALEKDNLVEPKKKTGEGSRGKAEGGKTPLKLENVDEMSDKEFQEFSEKLSREGTMSRI